MKLFFLRHGIAEDAHGTVSEKDRALTDEGREQLALIAQALQKLGVKPDLILTSPLVRAQQTAEIVAPVVGSQVAVANELQPGCILEDLQRLLSRYQHDTILLIGHEPDFSSMAARLINADERGIVLKKAGLIRIEIQGRPQAGRGRLSALLSPKMLTLIAGSGASE